MIRITIRAGDDSPELYGRISFKITGHAADLVHDQMLWKSSLFGL
jgi:hypothetical protein